jgi:anti-sigma-K factor RskA
MERVRSVERPFPVHEQAPQRSWLDRILPVWGIVSLILIIGLVGFNVLLWQRLNRLEVATSPGGMHAIPLSASQPGSRATGFVIIGADGMNGALVVDGLPPLAESQQYQLWLVRDGERTSGAIFSTDEEHYGGTRIKVDGSLFEYSSAGVTIEPAGGSPDPTGPQVLSGPLLLP